MESFKYLEIQTSFILQLDKRNKGFADREERQMFTRNFYGQLGLQRIPNGLSASLASVLHKIKTDGKFSFMKDNPELLKVFDSVKKTYKMSLVAEDGVTKSMEEKKKNTNKKNEKDEKILKEIKSTLRQIRKERKDTQKTIEMCNEKIRHYDEAIRRLNSLANCSK